MSQCLMLCGLVFLCACRVDKYVLVGGCVHVCLHVSECFS